MLRRDFIAALSASSALAALSPRVHGEEEQRGASYGAASRVPVEKQSNRQRSEFPEFDLGAIPFSRAGSLLTIGKRETTASSRLSLTTVAKSAITYRYQAGPSWSHEIADFMLLREGKELGYSFRATPQRIKIDGEGLNGFIAFSDEKTLYVELEGTDLYLLAPRSFSWRLQESAERFKAFDFASGLHWVVTANSGTMLDAEPKPPLAPLENGLLIKGKVIRVSLRFTSEETTDSSVAEAQTEINALEREFADWMKGVPRVPKAHERAAKTAWFLFWNLQVSSAGGYTRQTILSSKRSMSQIWSWDNCFNALAVAAWDPHLAWEQLFVILDHQRPDGLLPDAVNDLQPVFGFNKPPVWGWTVSKLLTFTQSDQRLGYLKEAYPRISRFHRWWFDHRDLSGDGLPWYLSGNDSGWDNATIFDGGWPVQSPDLTAHLILDAEALASMADELGLPAESASWHEQATRMIDGFHRRFVRNNELIVYLLKPQGEVEASSSSLLTRIPILLGKRLAPVVREHILADLSSERSFLAASGPASESLASPRYEPNGYWRGPVWGPSTLLIYDGLLQCGEMLLAKEIARRFCDTCARVAEFRENYDARTGAGQYDTGMTWSAAEFLLLAAALS
jgi:hypothetical protein